MTVSVIVCTLDRAESLRRTLASLGALRGDDHEVVVVDNGSSDHTPAVVAAAPCPVHSVVEPVLGLSVARNRGVAESRGEIVAFLDDDAEADAGWLEALATAYAGDARVGGVGGRIELVFPGGRPRWLPARLEGHYSALDLGDERRPFAPPMSPYGTNMSLRRAVFERVGGFSAGLGRRGADLLSNEEIELFGRVHALGVPVLYEPAALVHHHVEPERLSPRYVLRRAYAQGRSRARFESHLEPRRTLRSWARHATARGWGSVRVGGREALLAHRSPTPSAELVSAIVRLATAGGYAVEAVRVARVPRDG